MKKLLTIAAVLVLCASSAVSGYLCGYMKSYEVACRLSDLVRCYEDHLDSEDSPMEDYGCFEELEGIYLYDDVIGKPIRLENYVWAY